MYLILVREKFLKDRTLGTMYVREDLFSPELLATFKTLELPYKDNQKNISCIPEKIYKVVPFNGRRFKNVYKILDVQDRTDILIHCGNYPRDTRGCVLIGTDIDNENNLKNSKKAMKNLNYFLKSVDNINICIVKYKKEPKENVV